MKGNGLYRVIESGEMAMPLSPVKLEVIVNHIQDELEGSSDYGCKHDNYWYGRE